MADISPTDAALEGFRVSRENPSAIAVWSVIQLVLTVVTYGMMVSAAGPAVNALMEIVQQKTPDPQQLVELANRMSAQILPTYPILIPVTLIADAILSAAIMRTVLRPEERSLGNLRLGGDELRIVVVMLVKALILLAMFMLGSLVMRLLVGLLGVWGALLDIPAFFGLIAAMVFVSVRLSLATPQTFGEKKIAIFGSWGLTAGRFWPVLGCYFLTGVLAVVVLFVGLLATGALTAIVGLATGLAPKVDFTSLHTFFTPLQIVNLVIGSVLGAMVLAITGSPAAVIYRTLTGSDTREVF